MASAAPGDTVDLIVVGAGPGGYVAAIRAAQLGMRVTVVDRREAPGGTCLNVGCIPSKALLDSSFLYRQAREGLAVHGIQAREVTLDLGAMMARKRAVVDQLTGGVAGLFRSSGVSWLRGEASLTGSGSVSVRLPEGTVRDLTAPHILLATGGEPVELPELRVDGKLVLTSTDALELDKVPGSLVVVGAGAVGLELGSVWSRLGAEVTVVEIMPQILPGWDEELARALHRSLEKQGLTLVTGAKLGDIRVGPRSVRIPLTTATGAARELVADKVLVAVGRRPRTDTLGLSAVGIVPDAKTGRIPVDGKFRAAPGVYAIGDLIAGPALAHKAEEEGIAVAEILAGKPGHVSYATIPLVVYTHPEAAQIGPTERSLKEKGVPYRRGSFTFRANGRALAMDGAEGFVKLLAEAKTDRLLGAHLVGPHVSELVPEIVAVMEFGGSAEDIARMVHAHPTLSEVVREAALDVDGRAIHAPAQR